MDKLEEEGTMSEGPLRGRPPKTAEPTPKDARAKELKAAWSKKWEEPKTVEPETPILGSAFWWGKALYYKDNVTGHHMIRDDYETPYEIPRGQYEHARDTVGKRLPMMEPGSQVHCGEQTYWKDAAGNCWKTGQTGVRDAVSRAEYGEARKRAIAPENEKAEAASAYRKELLIKIYDKNDFVMGEDGFMRWWPTQGGSSTEHDLRIIADELARVNAPVQKGIEEYFAKNCLEAAIYSTS